MKSIIALKQQRRRARRFTKTCIAIKLEVQKQAGRLRVAGTQDLRNKRSALAASLLDRGMTGWQVDDLNPFIERRTMPDGTVHVFDYTDYTLRPPAEAAAMAAVA